MSQYIYIGSYLKSTSVQDAKVLSQSQTSRLLAVARGSTLEILEICSDHLSHRIEHNFYSYIQQLEVVKTQTTESLLVLTQQHQLIQATLQENELKLVSINLKIGSQESKDLLNYKMKINTSASLLCIFDYQNLYRLIKVKEGRKLEPVSIHNTEQVSIKDLEFLHGQDKLAVLSCNKLLHASHAGEALKESQISFYSETGQVENSMFFPSKPGKLLQPPTGQVLLIITSSGYYEVDTQHYIVRSEEVEEFGEVTAKCQVDATRWVVCNSVGKYFLITFGPTIETRSVGLSIPACSIVYLDSKFFFLAGLENLSRVVELTDKDQTYDLEEKSRFKGISCIHDLLLFNQNEIGIFNFLLASGHHSGGGVTCSLKAVMVNTITEIDVANVDGLFNVRLGTFDKFFVFSVLGSSKILEVQGNELNVTLFQGFQEAETSLEVFTYEDSIFQVTTSGIYRFSLEKCLIDSLLASSLGEKKVSLASGYSNTLAVCLEDSSVICFEVTKNSILKIWSKSFEKEISCINAHENFVAVSFWQSNSLQVIEKYSGNLKYSEDFTVPATAKSLQFVMFHESLYLFIGLRNGFLLYVNLETGKKLKLNLGCHNVVLREIWFRGKNFVLAASDITIILYEEKARIVHSSFDVNDIRIVSAYHTETLSDAMIVAFKDRIAVLNYQDLAKHSFEEYLFQMTVVRILTGSEYFVVVCQDIAGKFVLKSFNSHFEEVCSLVLQGCVHFIDCELIGDYLYVGCTYLDPALMQDTGSSLRIFQIVQLQIVQKNDLQSSNTITCIKRFINDLILADDRIDLFFIDKSELKIKDSLKCSGKVLSIDVCEDFFAVTCQRRFLEVLTVSSGKILSLYKFNKMDNGKTVKFIHKHCVCVSDSEHNLNIIEIQGQMVQHVAGFNLERFFGYRFVSFHVPEHIFEFQTDALAVSLKTGGLLMVIPLPKEIYDVLHCLQKVMERKIQCSEGWFEAIWNVKRRGRPVKGVQEAIFGDFLEEFERLRLEEQKILAEKVSKGLARKVSEEELIAFINSVKRIH